MIAALYVVKGGVYFGLDGVDPWPEDRDARNYRGPHPAVVHSPCGRWGRYWSGGPSANERRLKGDDGNCFAHGLWVVRTFGGVMEHPEASWAWAWFGLNRPPVGPGEVSRGWFPADMFGGYTCQVEQGHFGHRARKKTWLYVNGVPRDELPELPWCPSRGERLDEGFHSKAERDAARAAGVKPRPRLSTAENIATPPAFDQHRPQRAPGGRMTHEVVLREWSNAMVDLAIFGALFALGVGASIMRAKLREQPVESCLMCVDQSEAA